MKSGDNVVISVGGANTAYDPKMTTLHPDWVQVIKEGNYFNLLIVTLAKILYLQRLIPDYVNLVAAKIAKEAGVTVILDVGGMSSYVLPGIYDYLDYISPNEVFHKCLKFS